MEIRVLIADDDAGMRLMLSHAVARQEGFTVIAEAENGVRALELFEEHKPDLVFLDVEMPEMDGIETARQLQDLSPDTPLVFVTAHESYRPQAFEVYAVDYLVKPFDMERLEATLDRIKKMRTDREAAEALPLPAPRARLNRILIKGRDESVLLAFDDIVLIKREERQSVLCLRDGSTVQTRDTLSELEARLPEETFFRSHKSYILNLDYISHIYPYGRWTYITRLRGTKFDALITRERYEVLEQLMY